MKAECLKHLTNICDYKYPAYGDLATALKALQTACEGRRWALESSMETEAGLEQWVSELDTAWSAFKKKSEPAWGRDGSVMPQSDNDNNLRAYVDTQITLCKVEAVKIQQYRKVEREEKHEKTETLPRIEEDARVKTRLLQLLKELERMIEREVPDSFI